MLNTQTFLQATEFVPIFFFFNLWLLEFSPLSVAPFIITHMLD